jgi:hypothetical protein
MLKMFTANVQIPDKMNCILFRSRAYSFEIPYNIFFHGDSAWVVSVSELPFKTDYAKSYKNEAAKLSAQIDQELAKYDLDTWPTQPHANH